VTAARLAAWRDAFLAGGQEAMKKSSRDARDQEIVRLREKLGESTMDNELLREKITRLETGRPLRHRRSS
jgi:transposase